MRGLWLPAAAGLLVPQPGLILPDRQIVMSSRELVVPGQIAPITMAGGMLLNPFSFGAGVGGEPGAEIVYVGGTTAEGIHSDATHSVDLTALTGGIGSSPAEGDYVLFTYGKESSSDQTLSMSTAGYSKLTDPDLYGNDSIDVNLAVFSKFMGPSPDTTAVAANPTTASAWAAAFSVQVWRGVDPITPLDVALTTATGGNSGHPNPPAITPSTLGAVIVVCAGACSLNGGATLSQSGSELSNFIAVYGDNNDATNNDVTVAMGSKAWDGSGAFDPVALVGNTSGSIAWAAATLALRPAA